ncbi:MAG: mevalonate kinase [Lewinellaceae bacterium]|nr:mevalonate kinase [Lewinellaceae bacterium]
MEKYYAKLLLFGEYTIIKGSHALAMQLKQFSGHWEFAADDEPIRYNLEEFVQYLIRLNGRGELLTDMDLRRFERDVNKGLFFESDIPVGYGAGSSGALCAAVYSRYAINPVLKPDEAHYVRLKQQLAQLEGYFHGASSGADPLICYLGHALLLLPDGQARLAYPQKKNKEEPGIFFLLDTGISRKTSPLVERFLQKCENGVFAGALKSELVPATEQAIQDYLSGQRESLFSAVRRISFFQYRHFQEMIPVPFRAAWEEGLSSQSFYLKLCGAGGGGFLLGYCRELREAEECIKEGRVIPLERI